MMVELVFKNPVYLRCFCLSIHFFILKICIAIVKLLHLYRFNQSL